MRIIWFTWKDITNPLAGGAEVVASELAKRLVKDGHEVHFITAGHKGAASEETIDGYKVTRIGNRFTVYWQARRYYKQYLSGWADIAIDEVNTIPFLAKLYVRENNILFVHQLCKEIWFYQLPAYIGWIGYLLEPLYLRIIADRKVITVSESTKQDLIRHGFKSEKIFIISEGIQMEPLTTLANTEKYVKPTLLSLGSIRPMKRTLDQVKAFELAKKQMPDLQLIVAGDTSGSYAQKVLNYIAASPVVNDIQVLGRVSQEQKKDLMQRAHLIMVTSLKEGWGLVVTEANSQGTPAVVHNVDGLRDSVRHRQTGLIAKRRQPQALAVIIEEALTNPATYQTLRRNAWEWSKSITFDSAYKDFKQGIAID